jgi:hypothetical protein
MDEGARSPGVAFDRGTRGMRSWAVKGEGFVYLFGDVAGGRVPGGHKVRGLVTDTK